MRVSAGCVAFLVIVSCGAPAAAQVGSAASAPSSGNIWEPGSQTPGIYSTRQSPNVQPSAPAQPVSNQASQTASPSGAPQALGTPWAGGRLFSGVTLGTFYDDNVFATNTNHLHDWAFFARPELGWTKQGQNYTFTTDGWVEGRDYDHFTTENQVNGSAGAGFTVMPDNDTQIVSNARYIHAHLDRGSSETIIASTTPGMPSTLLSTQFAHPVSYDEGLESIALNKRYGNWWTSVGAAGLEIDYQNPTINSNSALAGTTVDLGYGDGTIGTANARLGYVVMPLTSAFGEVAINSRDWHVGYFDSTGYRAVGGLLFEQGPGARLKGEIWAGYMNQDYNGITMQKVSTWTYGMGLAAVVTNDITAVFEGRREAKEAALSLGVLPDGSLGANGALCTTLGGAVCVSVVESEVGGRLDYHILPKVVVGGGVTYLEDDYQGPLSFGRIDRTLSPLASIKYFATSNVTLGFDYRNIAFSSGGGFAPVPFTNVSALPYNRNVYLLSMNAKW